MRKIGFVISHKNNEQRRALLPSDISNIKNVENVYIEKGYGEVLGYSDQDYLNKGVNVVDRHTVLNSDVLIDVKLGDGDYIDTIENNTLLIGWAHAVQNIQFTDSVMNKKHSVIAWEELFEDGRYIFYRNREVAGEAAILHAYRYLGKMPYETKVAIIGNGMTAKGALRILHGLGAEVDVYGRSLENLFKKNMFNYDVIVNCVLWDTNRTDRLIYKEDLKRFAKGTMIIDVSCDPNLEIETSSPTTIDEPVYEIEGVIHYAVDNTPAMFPHTISKILSEKTSKLIDNLILGERSSLLESGLIIKEGMIQDEKIINYRKKRDLKI